MRRSIAALCLLAVALVPACSRNKPPNSLFDAAGYHVRGDKVFYLGAFPGKASEIAGADPTSFKVFDTTYAKDKSNAYFDGHPISGADATTFDVLDRGGFAEDRNHAYQLDRPISDDPAHFELLDGGMSKDSANVYWTDGGVLSDDPGHFAIVANNDHYLFTKDTRTVHVNGKPIARTTGNPPSPARTRGRFRPAVPQRAAPRRRSRLRSDRTTQPLNYPSASRDSTRSSLSRRASARLGMTAAALSGFPSLAADRRLLG